LFGVMPPGSSDRDLSFSGRQARNPDEPAIAGRITTLPLTEQEG
jgi:hypothetical protein